MRIPPNGHTAGFGVAFPTSPSTGDFFLRTDFLPNRLFRWNGTMWLKIEDNVKMSNPTDDKKGLLGSFVNNPGTVTLKGGKVVKARQSLSDALKPEID